MSDKIFCGSGKTYGQYGQIGINVCLSDIPKEHMSKDKNGKTWVKLNVCSKKTPTEKSTHYVEVNTWKPKPDNPGHSPEQNQYHKPQEVADELGNFEDPGEVPF